MLFVYCGNNMISVREKAHECAWTYEEKGFVIERIDSDTYQSGMLEDAVGATSLFGVSTVYVIDTPSTDEEFYADVREYLPAMQNSHNPFVLIEGKLTAADKKVFTKHASVFEEMQIAAEERFNTFSLADALARKDKKVLWVLLQDALREGISVEEIIGILWWQLKALRLAANTHHAAEAGMKDFPYNKAKQALSRFRTGEVEALSAGLLRIYHEGHHGQVDIDLALESWVLRM